MKPHSIDWSKWDHLLGTMSDTALALRIGCIELTVLNRRRRLGIASHMAKKFAAEVGLAKPRIIYRFGEDGAWPSGVYVITNTKTGDQYVGQSSQLPWRVKGHARALTLRTHQNRALAAAVRECGAEVFEIEIVELCHTEDLIQCEMKWIALLSPKYNGELEIDRVRRILRNSGS